MSTRWSRIGSWHVLVALGCVTGCAAPAGVAGAAGSEGRSALVAVSAEGPGASCIVGGQRVDVGIDANDDGVLDPTEVTRTTYVCDGAAGAAGASGAAGANGEDGLPGAKGQQGEAGPQGPMGPVGPRGPMGETGATGAAGATGETGATGATGAAGADGKDGLDGKDGIDGTNGIDGRDGVDGKDGFSAVVKTTLLSPGAECAAGGQKIEAGVDDGRDGGIAGDGQLQEGEITSTATVCNATGGGAHLYDANDIDMGTIVASGDMTGQTMVLSPAGWLYSLRSDMSILQATLYYTTNDCSGPAYTMLSTSSLLFRQSDKFFVRDFAGSLYRSNPGTFATHAISSYAWSGGCTATTGSVASAEVTAATPADVGLASSTFSAPFQVR